MTIHEFIEPFWYCFFGILFAFIIYDVVQALMPKQLKICTECFTEGYSVKTVKGSSIITIILYFFGIVPGILYSSWRYSTIKLVCPCCKHDTMIPVNTPRGEKIHNEISCV